MASVTSDFERLEDLVGAAYQIVGVLAGRCGLFDHPDVQNALDALANLREDPAKPLIPFHLLPVDEVVVRRPRRRPRIR